MVTILELSDAITALEQRLTTVENRHAEHSKINTNVIKRLTQRLALLRRDYALHLLGHPKGD